jgi:hypothetical protein
VKTFVAGLNLEFDFLSFRERLETIHRDGREVHEDIFSSFLLDEAEPFGIIEPLHLALRHDRLLLGIVPLVLQRDKPEMACGAYIGAK